MALQPKGILLGILLLIIAIASTMLVQQLWEGRAVENSRTETP